MRRGSQRGGSRAERGRGERVQPSEPARLERRCEQPVVAIQALGDAGQPVLISAKGRLGTAPAGSPTTTSLAATVERLSAQLTRQQRQIDRLRDRVKGG